MSGTAPATGRYGRSHPTGSPTWNPAPFAGSVATAARPRHCSSDREARSTQRAQASSASRTTSSYRLPPSTGRSRVAARPSVPAPLLRLGPQRHSLRRRGTGRYRLRSTRATAIGRRRPCQPALAADQSRAEIAPVNVALLLSRESTTLSRSRNWAKAGAGGQTPKAPEISSTAVASRPPPETAASDRSGVSI